MTSIRLFKMACAAGALVSAGMPAVAQAPDLAMLDSLQKGAWEIRLRPEGGNRRVCVQTGREFIQLRQNRPGCDRFIVQDETEKVAVQYRCSGSGYGRTTIRRESPGLVQIQSRGFSGGRPFAIEAEARHVGKC